MWQSFVPSMDGNLTAIEVYMGATIPSDPCISFSGTLAIYAGEGVKTNADYFPGMTALHSQAVLGANCVCSSVVSGWAGSRGGGPGTSNFLSL